MRRWWFNADFRDRAAAQLFADLDSTFAVDGTLVASDPLSRVLRVDTADGRYYVKRYAGKRRTAVRRWFGLHSLIAPQRVVREWQNLSLFRRWGIPTATLVAYGLERRFGSFVRGALVTEEIPDTCDLAQLARLRDRRLGDRRWVAEVSRQVARITRAMHDAGFAHNDLKWRNLLVTGGEAPVVYLIDCPSGCFWWRPFLDYRIVKDLACLDKVAKHHLSRTQRLRFYLDYVQRRRLSAADKRVVRRILRFFEGRE